MVTKTRISPVDGDVNYTEYQYDFRNRMTKVTQYSKHPEEGGIILHEQSNRYDASGRRIQVVRDGEEMISVYDGAGFLANEWAHTSMDSTVTEHFLFTDSVDQLVTQCLVGDRLAWPLSDYLGTIRDAVDNAAQIMQNIQYSTFGAPVFANVTKTAQSYTFTGRTRESIPRMTFHRARFYDVKAGRFVSMDPIGFTAGDTNLYRIVQNSPYTGTDPSGELALTLIGMGLIVGAVGLFSVGKITAAATGILIFLGLFLATQDSGLDLITPINDFLNELGDNLCSGAQWCK